MVGHTEDRAVTGSGYSSPFSAPCPVVGAGPGLAGLTGSVIVHLVFKPPSRQCRLRPNPRAIASLAGLLAGALLAGGQAGASPSLVAAMPRAEDFTLLWWAEGPPYYLGMKTPPPAPILCFQSGTWGLALDTKTLAVRHHGRFDRPMSIPDALERGRTLLTNLPAGTLEARIVAAGRSYRCVGRGAPPKDEFYFPVRFIETGRLFQRVAIEGLEFADADGRRLGATGRLEVACWPDRVALALEVTSPEAIPDGKLFLTFGQQHAAASFDEPQRGARVTLGLFPASLSAPALEVTDGMKAEFDAGLGAWRVRLADRPWRNAKGTYYPEEELDRWDRWRFTLRNESDLEAVAPLLFVPDRMPAITGFTPMLCDPDGTPSGLPVQLSKNWHSRPEKGELPHQGAWFHGGAFLRVPPRSTREVVFAIAYARWGGVPAASHAQLCLVGWGHNQFWEEAAIGSFGESICYEPGRVQRRCFIDDIRPLMTLPQADAKPFGWAGNAGGGDFLAWVDAAGQYQGFRATRSDPRAPGPCLTDVGYFEETLGGELRARMRVGLARSDDYLRAFHRVRYEVRQPVRWQRLAFYQLGADFYNETPAQRAAVGDLGGLREEWTPRQGKDTYDRRAIPLSGQHPWIAIHGLDRARLREGQAAASRGLIVRSWHAVLGGRTNAVPHAATYATEWGTGNFKTTIELTPPPDVTELRPGDFVEAELELVMFPTDVAAYYGPDESFRKALAEHADTWRLVHREAVGNALELEGRHGTVQRAYPVQIAVAPDQRADVTVRGGLGYVPVTFVGLTRHRGYTLWVDDRPLDQSVHGHDFWQTDYDPVTQTWSLTYNLRFAGGTTSLRWAPEESR